MLLLPLSHVLCRADLPSLQDLCDRGNAFYLKAEHFSDHWEIGQGDHVATIDRTLDKGHNAIRADLGETYRISSYDDGRNTTFVNRRTKRYSLDVHEPKTPTPPTYPPLESGNFDFKFNGYYVLFRTEPALKPTEYAETSLEGAPCYRWSGEATFQGRRIKVTAWVDRERSFFRKVVVETTNEENEATTSTISIKDIDLNAKVEAGTFAFDPERNPGYTKVAASDVMTADR